MNQTKDLAKMISIISIMGALAVILGAFGAHALKEKISEVRLNAYHTGISYQFYHVCAMVGVLILYKMDGKANHKRTFYLFLSGIILFSGSLYLLALQEVIGVQLSFLGPVTPIGGLLFVAGWLSLLFKK